MRRPFFIKRFFIWFLGICFVILIHIFSCLEIWLFSRWRKLTRACIAYWSTICLKHWRTLSGKSILKIFLDFNFILQKEPLCILLFSIFLVNLSFQNFIFLLDQCHFSKFFFLESCHFIRVCRFSLRRNTFCLFGIWIVAPNFNLLLNILVFLFLIMLEPN